MYVPFVYPVPAVVTVNAGVLPKYPVPEFVIVSAGLTPCVIEPTVAPSVPPTIFSAVMRVNEIPEPVPPMLFADMNKSFHEIYPLPASVILMEPKVPSAATTTVANAPEPADPADPFDAVIGTFL